MRNCKNDDEFWNLIKSGQVQVEQVAEMIKSKISDKYRYSKYLVLKLAEYYGSTHQVR